MKGPLSPAFGDCHVPTNSSPWHCLLWSVRWVTSLEGYESGQSVPLINPDLILLATVKPESLLPSEACPFLPGCWEQEELAH